MDVRMLAVLLLLVGMALGLLPGVYLFLISLVTIVGGVTVIMRESERAPGGTSGALGLSFMIVGALVCTLVPAWFVYAIR